MNFTKWILIHMYRWMLACYPKAFQIEIADEMQAVFIQILGQSTNEGSTAMSALFEEN